MHTVAEKANVTIKATINETNLLKNVKHMFTSSWTMFAELMQNARRAHATKVEFTLDETGICEVTDDGDGVKDFQKFIAIFDSGWDDQTMISENPFGMGFLACLMACQSVEIHSGWHHVTVSLKEIQDKKAMTVLKSTTFLKGTKIRLLGLDENLCKTRKVYASADEFVLKRELESFSKGFPIDVFFNGTALERPHAMANLSGRNTAVGFVSTMGIDYGFHHDQVKDREWMTNLPKSFQGATFYLQGLPITVMYSSRSEQFVVHLDSKRFIPRVPDRTNLYDAGNQIPHITDACTKVLIDFLVEEKKKASPKAFVLKYWSHCFKLGVRHLLKDIPLVPLRVFKQVRAASKRSEEVFESPYTAARGEFSVVTMEEFARGELKAFSNNFTYVDYADPRSVEVLSFLRRKAFLCTNAYFEGHWLEAYLAKTENLLFEVVPNNDKTPVVKNKLYVGEATLNIILCDSYTVKVTSTVDPGFVHEDTVDDSSYIFNLFDYGGPGDEYQPELQVLVPTNSSGYGVMESVDSFNDEDANLIEEDRDEAEQSLMDLVSSHRGESFSSMLMRNVDHDKLVVTSAQQGTLFLGKVTDDGKRFERMQVMDLNAELSGRIAAAIGEKLGQEGLVTAEMLSTAMADVFASAAE